MKILRILIVDDDSSLRIALSRFFTRKGHQVITATSMKEAKSLSKSTSLINIALIDIRLPDGDGLNLLSFLKRKHPDIQSIILTGYGTIPLAVQATQNGAFHFLTKPFNMEELFGVIIKANEHKNLKQKNKNLQMQLYEKYRFDNIIGQHPKMKKVMCLIEKVANSDSTILIIGDSGTGKEVVANALHYNSSRSDQMFIPINCGAIPPDLLESELFGHTKGAFTGALSERTGRFELANKGTLFLDEIGEMSPALQVKLLRVLQEKRFEPVGSTKTIDVNVRIIAATNINLEQAVKNGHFREDLYYRLNVIPIVLPTLKERKEDIPLLLQHFISIFNTANCKSIEGISPEAIGLLCSYSWPGNIRELKNLVEHISILKDSGIIDVYDLPPQYQHKEFQSSESYYSKGDIPDSGIDFNSAVNAYENKLIMQALKKTEWNRNQAAKLLKLNRTTLVEKIKKKGLRETET